MYQAYRSAPRKIVLKICNINSLPSGLRKEFSFGLQKKTKLRRLVIELIRKETKFT